MKKIFVVVDYQNDFVDGALGFPDAYKLDEKIAKRINEERENGSEIAFTFDTHNENYLSTQEGKNLPVVHCIEGTEGHKLYGETAKCQKDTDKVFYKPCFGSMELAEYLRAGNYDEVEFCGLVSNICVISNVILAKAALPEAKVTVRAELTDSFDKTLNKETLDILKGVQVEVIE